MPRVQQQITIIASRKRHSASPFDWMLGFEGMASSDEVNATCQRLLNDYSHVKVFSAGKLLLEHLKSESRRPNTSTPRGAVETASEPTRTGDMEANARPPAAASGGVHLRIGDRVKVGGHTYRVFKVTELYAIAIPKGASPHLKALKIAPPVTSAAVRLKTNPPVTPIARTIVRSLPKQKKKHRKGVPVGRHVVAVSSAGVAQVKYGDGRWSRFPMSGGRPDSNRRRH